MLQDKKETEKQGDNKLHLIINDKSYDWNEQYITGRQIRDLGNVDEDKEIFLAIKEPWEDELIENEQEVNLARPGIERFFSESKDVKVTLIVNGREESWDKKRISFKQVVILAFGNYEENPDIVYTITYDRGPKQNPEGSMIKDDKVFVKNKMIFNVTATDKS